MTENVRPDDEEPPARPRGFGGHVRTALQSLADGLLPPVCLACHAGISSHHALCGACWRDIRFIRAPLCDRLGIPLPFDTGGSQVSAAALADPPIYDRARAVGHFTGTLRTLVHGLKYHDRHEPVGLLARWMVTAGRDLLSESDVIVPVPLNRWRLLWRRFNQASLLAERIGRQARLPVSPMALARIKATRAQVGLTETQRRDNVRAAFKVPAPARAVVGGRRVLLIDDVITTGATANACARALKRAGATRVDVLAVGLVGGP